ncbi:MAG: Ig-like domain-containing protein [Pseudomonadota bacterium]
MSTYIRNELLIVDAVVDDWERLYQDVTGRAHVHVLIPAEDVFDVISRELDTARYDALHIVGHGMPGAIKMAGRVIDLSVVSASTDTLRGWGDALIGCDILIYGCETGAGDAGRAFVQAIADLTGAHVAAASQAIGAGHWDLDVHVGGVMHPEVIFSGNLQGSYASTFANVTFSIDPPFSVESTNSLTTFNFTLDEAPAPGEFVSIYLYASTAPGTAPQDAITNEISQFNVFDLFVSENVVGIPLVVETNGVPVYDADASVTAGASSVPDFTVFELRLTQIENSFTISGFNDFVDDGPRTVFWNIADNPNDGTTNTVTNGTIEFTEVDDPSELPAQNADPDAVNDTATADFESPVTVSVLANDTDADGDTLSIASVTQGSNGSVAIDGTNVVYTPDAGFSGPDSFTYEVSDGNGGTDTATVNVTVGAAPQTPIVGFTVDTTTLIEDEGTAVTFTFNVDNLPPGGVTVALGVYRPGESGTNLLERGIGDFDFFPPPPNIQFSGLAGQPFGFNGNSGLAFTIAQDGATITLPIFDDNDIPPDQPGGNANTDFGIEEQVWRLIDFSLANPPFNTVDEYDVAPGQGEVTLTLKDTANFDPVAEDDSATTAFDTEVEIDVLSNDSDLEGDTLAITSFSAPTQGGTVRIEDQGTDDTSDDTLVYTPLAGFEGEDTFTYLVGDGNGGEDTATVTVTVEAQPNRAPDAVNDSASTGFDTPLTLNVLANDTDDDGDTLSVTGVTQGANGSVVIDGTNVVYTPNAGFEGNDSFTYTISDGNGGTDTATVSVTVDAEPNTAPDAANDSAETDFETAVTISVLSNDNDVDGDTLSIIGVTQGANGSVAIDGTNVVYTPDAGFEGDDSFTYTISDGNGGEDTATVSVTVAEEPNTAPDAANDTAGTGFETPVTINVLANDTDDDGDTLSISGVTQGANGSVVIDGTSVVYTPDAGFEGVDTFTYTISDGNGGEDTATVEVTVDAEPNTAPDAVNDTAGTGFETPVTISVLANDTDDDGDALSITDVTQGANGSVVIDGASVVYTPDAGFEGDDSFTYTISDGNGGTDTATVAVTVDAAPNTAPDAVNDMAGTGFETPVTVNVLANDTDDDGDTLSVSGVTQGANGSVMIDGTSVVYTPDAGFSGDDSFTYTISDGNGGTDTATVAVTVDAEPNTAPDAVDDTARTGFQTPLTVAVLANDSDEDGDALSITGVTQGANGSVVIDGASVVYTPDAGFEGDDSFTYTISDGNGGTDTATVSVTVDSQPNSAPDAVDDTAGTAFGTPVTVSVLANDTDDDGDALSVTGVTQGGNGSVVIDGTNIIYTPDAGFSGGDSFTYTVDDGNGGTDTATVAVTVEDNVVVPDPVVSVSISPDTLIEDEGTAAVISIAVEGDIPDGGLLVPLSFLNVNTADGAVDDRPLGDFDVFAAVFGGGFVGVELVRGWTANDGLTLRVLDNTASITLPIFDDPDRAPGEPGFNVNDDIGIEETTITIVTQDDQGTVFDGFAISQTAGSDTVTLRDMANFDPVAQDDSATTAFETSTTVDVLANDTDLDGDTLSVSSVSQGANGSVVIDGTSVVYTPNAGFSGDDSFTYTVSDGNGGTDTATVAVTVEDGGGVVLNPVIGTARSELLRGTDGDDLIDGKGGVFDRLFGGEGADTFVFGDEASDGKADRDVIFDYAAGVDQILLENGASVASFTEFRGNVVLELEGDGDLIIVNGTGNLTFDDLTIVNDEFSFI